jgi:hypothetical protein
MKATKSITDAKGVTWTISHSPGAHIQDIHIGRSTLGHYTSFCTRSGAMKWLKRNAR